MDSSSSSTLAKQENLQVCRGFCSGFVEFYSGFVEFSSSGFVESRIDSGFAEFYRGSPVSAATFLGFSCVCFAKLG